VGETSANNKKSPEDLIDLLDNEYCQTNGVVKVTLPKKGQF